MKRMGRGVLLGIHADELLIYVNTYALARHTIESLGVIKESSMRSQIKCLKTQDITTAPGPSVCTFRWPSVI